jgi:hypothetical protein
VDDGRWSPKAKEVVQAITRDREGLLDSVKGLSPGQTDFRPREGSWSIDDVLHHLALAEEASAKLMSIFRERAIQSGIGQDPNPEASVLQSLAAIVAGAEGTMAPAPDRVTPRSKVEAPAALLRLDAARRRTLQNLQELCPFDCAKLSQRHPFFGELDLYQWLLVSGWHERRHTRQIERIKSDPLFP